MRFIVACQRQACKSTSFNENGQARPIRIEVVDPRLCTATEDHERCFHTTSPLERLDTDFDTADQDVRITLRYYICLLSNSENRQLLRTNLIGTHLNEHETTRAFHNHSSQTIWILNEVRHILTNMVKQGYWLDNSMSVSKATSRDLSIVCK